MVDRLRSIIINHPLIVTRNWWYKPFKFRNSCFRLGFVQTWWKPQIEWRFHGENQWKSMKSWGHQGKSMENSWRLGNLRSYHRPWRIWSYLSTFATSTCAKNRGEFQPEPECIPVKLGLSLDDEHRPECRISCQMCPKIGFGLRRIHIWLRSIRLSATIHTMYTSPRTVHILFHHYP